jgi:cytoskeletal protein RodZ
MNDERDDLVTSGDEDDWFAVPGTDFSEPETIVWEDTGPPPPPPPPRRRPPVGPWVAIVALVAAIALIVGGVLVAQALTDSDSDQAGSETTATAPTTTTETTTTPETATTPTDTTPSTTPSTPTGDTTVPQGVTLRPGDSGTEVQALQQALKTLGYDPGAIDGDYGPATQAAVVAFQTAEGLSADGVAGPETLTALAAALQTG